MKYVVVRETDGQVDRHTWRDSKKERGGVSVEKERDSQTDTRMEKLEGEVGACEGNRRRPGETVRGGVCVEMERETARQT